MCFKGLTVYNNGYKLLLSPLLNSKCISYRQHLIAVIRYKSLAK